MIRQRAVTLYYASVGVREALFLLWGVVTAPFVSAASRRRRLHAAIVKDTAGLAAYSFNSGRGALAAALKAIGVGPTDEVLLSSYTCLAVPTAVLAAGAKPIYCDIDPATLNVTVDSVRRALTPQTKVIVVQHTLGSIAPVDEIVELARARDIVVIEDCALAIGSTIRARPVGSIGHAAIFSLELSKTITTGWGGILVVNDKRLVSAADQEYDRATDIPWGRAARMATQTAICGISLTPWAYRVGKYVVYHGFARGLFLHSTPAHEQEGRVDARFTARLPGPQALLARHQWSQLGDIARRCERNAAQLRAAICHNGYEPLGLPRDDVRSVTPRVSFLVTDRAKIIQHFEREEVYLGSWFDGPLSPLPKAGVFNYDPTRYPEAAGVAKHVVNFASHSRISDDDIQRMGHLLSTYKSNG